MTRDGALMKAIADPVLLVDGGGHILDANPATETLSGYTQAELRALPIADLLDDAQSGVRTRVRERIATGDVVRRPESWLVTKRGDRIPVAITASPLFDDANELLGIILVARDIRDLQLVLHERDVEIERRRVAEVELRDALASIEDRLAQTRSQLLHAERRATLGTLAGGVGHELRNIVQVQMAAVEMIGEHFTTHEISEDLRAALRDLDRTTEHVKLHGHRLTRLARPGPDHVAPTQLDDVIRDVVAMLLGAGRLHRITVELELTARSLVTVNRTRIEQILVNLIGNAVDATTLPGTITIGTRDDGRRVHVSVRDTGSGMTPDVLARIFEPFFTTKGEEQGTGLGLPVVREIVESYGGALVVESTPGAGSTFRFDLPSVSATPSSSSAGT
jgi:PAS domain S-box-containing protein